LRRYIKVWDPASGANYTSIEPGQEINDVCVWDRTVGRCTPKPVP
jgi:ribosome biogenesis protein ENP2